MILMQDVEMLSALIHHDRARFLKIIELVRSNPELTQATQPGATQAVNVNLIKFNKTAVKFDAREDIPDQLTESYHDLCGIMRYCENRNDIPPEMVKLLDQAIESLRLIFAKYDLQNDDREPEGVVIELDFE